MKYSKAHGDWFKFGAAGMRERTFRWHGEQNRRQETDLDPGQKIELYCIRKKTC